MEDELAGLGREGGDSNAESALPAVCFSCSLCCSVVRTFRSIRGPFLLLRSLIGRYRPELCWLKDFAPLLSPLQPLPRPNVNNVVTRSPRLLFSNPPCHARQQRLWQRSWTRYPFQDVLQLSFQTLLDELQQEAVGRRTSPCW